MKIKLSQLQDSAEALKGLGTMKVKANIAYRIGRVLGALKEPLNEMEERRVELLRRVGEEDEEQPGMFKITDAKTWNEEFKLLMNEEVEVNIQQKLKLSDFGDAQAEGNWFAPLEWCIEE